MTATRSIADLPGPPRLPLLGNAHQLARVGRLHSRAEEWGRRYGPIFRLEAGRRPMVVIGERDAIDGILRDRPEGYSRPARMREVLSEMSAPGYPSGAVQWGVFAAEGEDWRKQRRLVVTALNSNHLHRFFGIVRTATARLHGRLAAVAGDGDAIEISDLFSSFTVDVTSALALGHDLDTLERGDVELQRHIQHMVAMIGRRIAAPVPYWRWVKLPADRALDRSVAEIYAAVEDFIERGRARLEAEPERCESPRNLLDGLLAAQKTDGAFNDEEIVYNVVTILIAGEDTTAHTLGWTVWLLASAPQAQERLAAEAVEVLGEERFPTEYEDTERLVYAEAVLRESMRLKSIIPVLPMEPNRDTTICGTRIPAGTQLLLLLRSAARDAAGRSDDFAPERWLDGSEGTAAQKSLTFGAGPRFCPGRNLAFLESKAALAMLARSFRLELDESSGPVREEYGATMVPRGLRVRVRPARAATAVLG